MSLPPIRTAEELYAHPDRERYELVRGRLRVCEPPGGEHGRVAMRLGSLVHTYVERHDLGAVLVESGYILERHPDTVRGPDISFVSKARMGANSIPKAFIPGTPDLAVEVLSPNDRPSETAERIADYFGAGARLVWVVDPDRLCVVVHHPGGRAAELGRGDMLDGEDVVPGFQCDVAEVFARRSQDR